MSHENSEEDHRDTTLEECLRCFDDMNLGAEENKDCMMACMMSLGTPA